MYMRNPNYVPEKFAPSSLLNRIEPEQQPKMDAGKAKALKAMRRNYKGTPSPISSNTGGATLMTTHGIPGSYTNQYDVR